MDGRTDAIIGTKGALSVRWVEFFSDSRVPLVKTRKVAVRGSRGRKDTVTCKVSAFTGETGGDATSPANNCGSRVSMAIPYKQKTKRRKLDRI